MRTRVDQGTPVEGLITYLQGTANATAATGVTLAAAYSMPAESPPINVFDPGGAARNLLLPPSPREGQMHIIINAADAAETITLQDSAGNALSPASTIAQNKRALVVFVGGKWWALVGANT
jgi:hypothetical protein